MSAPVRTPAQSRRRALKTQLRPKEHRGPSFTDEFFSPKEQPEPRPKRPQATEAQLDAKARKEAEWMKLIRTAANGRLPRVRKGVDHDRVGTAKWTRLLPVEKMKDYEFPPELLPRSPGHYRDWIRACKGSVPGVFEFQCLNSLYRMRHCKAESAIRLNTKHEWDAEKMQI